MSHSINTIVPWIAMIKTLNRIKTSSLKIDTNVVCIHMVMVATETKHWWSLQFGWHFCNVSSPYFNDLQKYSKNSGNLCAKQISRAGLSPGGSCIFQISSKSVEESRSCEGWTIATSHLPWLIQQYLSNKVVYRAPATGIRSLAIPGDRGSTVR